MLDYNVRRFRNIKEHVVNKQIYVPSIEIELQTKELMCKICQAITAKDMLTNFSDPSFAMGRFWADI